LAGIYGRSGKMLINEPHVRFHALEVRVRKTIQEFNMITPGEHVLVAVSGGADSTALLICLHKLASEFRLSLTVAHLNHRIRGVEGDADVEFVRQMSADLKLPFISEIIEVKDQAVASRQNLEELARHIRYDFLRRTAIHIGAQKIAVGHNLNDQAETAIFRFLRGSGTEGLSAIHPVVDGLIIRPLLDCSRDLIGEYLKRQNASYRDDSSNTDLKHARNRIRRELIPYLQANFNPQLIPAIAREVHLTRETWSFIESHAADAYANLHSQAEEGISLKISEFQKLHPALQKEVLRKALKECLGSIRGISSVHIHSLLSLCKMTRAGTQIHIPHGGIAIRQFDDLILMKHTPQTTAAYAYPLDLPGECEVAEIQTKFRCTIAANPDSSIIKQDFYTKAFLEQSVLPKFLIIRSRIPGDRYGGPGHRKVKKMLIEHRIPRLQRSLLPMIVAENDVIWIPGFPPARAYEVKQGSSSCILVEMIKSAE
jgi:tRNA(Ile)-lysidine synthase